MRAALLLALLGLAGLAAAQQQYTDLQPPAYRVELSFKLNGEMFDPLPCPDKDVCLPQVSTTAADSVIIEYSSLQEAAPGNTISLMYCFSNSSAVDRPWRKANPVISKDRKCNVAKPFAKGLPTGNGTYTWTPTVNMPGSVYNIQLLEVVAGSDPTTYAAMGRSVGFFQVVPIDPRPTWLMALVGVFCTLGPITLAGFFTWEKVIKKE